MIVPDTNFQSAVRNAGRSKYLAVSQAIRDAISAGDLKIGQRLPPVRELAYQLSITPGTVARAYRILIDEGRLVAGVGRGTFVAGQSALANIATDSLIYPVTEAVADFRSSRVPDVGQGALIDAALIKVGQSHMRRHINYPTSETDLEAREAVLGWADSHRFGALSVESIVLGNGAQNCNLMALQAVLRGAAPVIVTEDLAYPGVRHAARLLRAEVVGVPMDDHGIIPEALAETVKRYGAQVLVTASGVHSPTTIHTGLDRKQELAKVIERLGIWVIEDDCYGFGDQEVPTYRALIGERAFYTTSITKSVSGSLRFGWAISPVGQETILRQVAQSSFYGVAQPILDVCADLIGSGTAEEIRGKVIAMTQKRVRQTVNMLGRWDIRWRDEAPFIWMTMPRGWRASAFARACEKDGVNLRPADEFALVDDKAPNAVRLAVTTCSDDALFEEALRKIDRLLQSPPAIIDG